jgi:hypothetical protein
VALAYRESEEESGVPTREVSIPGLSILSHR